MIQHPSQVSRAAAALELLTGKTFTATVKGNWINVSHKSGPNAEGHEFQSEEAYMTWMLEEIIRAAQGEINYFKTHPIKEK